MEVLSLVIILAGTLQVQGELPSEPIRNSTRDSHFNGLHCV